MMNASHDYGLTNEELVLILKSIGAQKRALTMRPSCHIIWRLREAWDETVIAKMEPVQIQWNGKGKDPITYVTRNLRDEALLHFASYLTYCATGTRGHAWLCEIPLAVLTVALKFLEGEPLHFLQKDGPAKRQERVARWVTVNWFGVCTYADETNQPNHTHPQFERGHEDDYYEGGKHESGQ